MEDCWQELVVILFLEQFTSFLSGFSEQYSRVRCEEMWRTMDIAWKIVLN